MHGGSLKGFMRFEKEAGMVKREVSFSSCKILAWETHERRNLTEKSDETPVV